MLSWKCCSESLINKMYFHSLIKMYLITVWNNYSKYNINPSITEKMDT